MIEIGRLITGTKEETLQIINLHKQGLSLSKIAVRIGRSKSFVKRRVDEYKKGNIYIPYEESVEVESKVIDLYKQGLNANKISKIIGKSYYFVSMKIEDYKLKEE